MKPVKPRWPVALGVFALVMLLIAFAWRFLPVDLTKEEEPFRSMAMPPKQVIGTIWMDGGSVSVRVTDRNGRIHEFVLPYDHSNRWTPYTTAYRGVYDMNELRAKGIPMKDPERARVLATRLLEDHANLDDESVRGTVGYLKRGGRSDLIGLPDKITWWWKDLWSE